MNEQKVRAEIEKIVTEVQIKGWSQTHPTKKAFVELEALGLLPYLPAHIRPDTKCGTYVQEILKAANNKGGKKVVDSGWSGGDGYSNTYVTEPSGLWLAMNETPEPEPVEEWVAEAIEFIDSLESINFVPDGNPLPNWEVYTDKGKAEARRGGFKDYRYLYNFTPPNEPANLKEGAWHKVEKAGRTKAWGRFYSAAYKAMQAKFNAFEDQTTITSHMTEHALAWVAGNYVLMAYVCKGLVTPEWLDRAKAYWQVIEKGYIPYGDQGGKIIVYVPHHVRDN